MNLCRRWEADVYGWQNKYICRSYVYTWAVSFRLLLFPPHPHDERYDVLASLLPDKFFIDLLFEKKKLELI